MLTYLTHILSRKPNQSTINSQHTSIRSSTNPAGGYNLAALFNP
jgi:hypothetical protein